MSILTPFWRYIFGGMYLLAAIVPLASHLLFGAALYRVSRALALPRPWLSWIPFGQWYRLGQLADLYTDNRMTTEADRNAPFYAPSVLRRKLMGYGIGLSAAGAVTGAAVCLCVISAIIGFFLLLGAAAGGEPQEPLISEGALLLAGFIAYLGGIICPVLAILFLTAYCPALRRVFTALGASAAALRTLLSVLLPPVGGILLLVAAKKTDDLPRRFSPPPAP